MQLIAEDDVFDKHGFNLDTPAGGNLLDDLRCRLRNLLPALDDILEDAGSDYMAQRGLGAFDERLSHVRNAKRGYVGETTP